MTRQEKTAWLERYLDAERKVDSVTERIKRWGSRAEKVTMAFSMVPSSGRGVSSPQSVAVEKIAELQIDLVEKINTMQLIQEEIEIAISGLPEPKHRKVLQCVYIDGVKTWKGVSAATDYSDRHASRIYEEAINLLKVDA